MLGGAGDACGIPRQHWKLLSLPCSPCLELAHLLQQLQAEGEPGRGLGGAAWVSSARLRLLGLRCRR